MEYHLKLFDSCNGAKWAHRAKEGLQLSNRLQTDLKERLTRRHGGDPDLLDGVLEIRRQVIRYDNGQGVPVYYIRLAQVHYSAIKAALPQYILGKHLSKWVVVENGTLEGEDPWAEYVASKEERNTIAWFAGPTRDLRWPIVDPSCVVVPKTPPHPHPAPSVPGGTEEGSYRFGHRRPADVR